MQSAQDRFDTAASRVAKQGPSPQNSVDILQARNQNAASAKAIRVADDMSKSAIDLVG